MSARRKQLELPTRGAASLLAAALAATGLAFVSYADVAERLALASAGVGQTPALAKTASLRSWRHEQLFDAPDLLAAKRGEVREDARAALIADPLDARALRQTALVDGLDDLGAGQTSLLLAERITRRDLLTQLALIELASRGGDTRAALRHYDRAMTAHPESQAPLLSVLAPAANDPAISEPLAAYAGRDWFSAFLTSAIGLGLEPISAAELWRRSAPRLGTTQAARLRAILLAQALERQDARAARLLLGEAGAGGLVGGAGFKAAALDAALAPLTWRLEASEAIQASPLPGGALEVEVASERSGLIAERLTMLPPGSYRLRFELQPVAGARLVRLTWLIACEGKGERPTPPLQVPPSRGEGPQELGFQIDANCPVQRWRLSGTAEAALNPSRVRIASLDLRR